MPIRKSRVRLCPSLIAQTKANPHPKGPKVLKAFGIIILIAAATWFVGFRNKDHAQSPSPFPENPAVLGAQKENLAPGEYYNYEVQKGDSLFSISQKFQVNWETIVSINGMKEPYLISAGDMVKLPANTVTKQQQFYDNLKNKIYVVDSGDSFVSIAQKLNISVTDLLRANPDLKSPDFIKPGQTLRLP